MAISSLAATTAKDPRPKHLKLAQLLEAEVRHLEPNAPIPPVTSLMDRFGVSQGTVVHALRHLRTKKLVIRPPGRKRLVAVGTDKRISAILNILLVRSSWSSPDYDAMSYALLEEASRQRIHLETFYTTGMWREDLAAAVRAHDAVLFMPSSNDPPQIANLLDEHPIPAVMLWEEHANRNVYCVTDDNVEVGRAATSHLLGLGHKKVAVFLSEPARSSVSKARLAGWEKIIREETGEKHPESLIIDCAVEPGKNSIVGSYERLRRWLYQRGNKFPATAVFCLHWTGALGMLRALREVGIEVPGHVSILAHGGENRLCEFTNPALSVIQSNAADFAHQAFGILKSACMGEPPSQHAFFVESRIIERESCIRWCRGKTTTKKQP